jgi:signal transduction histidine kinase
VILRFLPDTVFGRLMSALVAVVGVAFLVIVALIVRERRDLLFWGGEAAAIANVVAETSIALAALDTDARAAELARLGSEPITISRSSNLRPEPFGRDEFVAAVSSLSSRLERDLGASYRVTIRPARPGPAAAQIIRVRTQPPRGFERRGERFPPPGTEREPRGFGGGDPGERRDGGSDERRAGGGSGERPEARGNGGGALGPGPAPENGNAGGPVWPFGRFRGGPPLGRELDVAVALPDGVEVVFRTDVPRAGPPLPSRIFVELALLTLALGVVLYLMARTITRPLTDLAQAADAVGRGERHAALRETGARELRDATHAFNVMQERLYRYLDSRTHVLAAMSHDLRTPLTRLKLRVETLDDAGQRERFGTDLDEMIAMVTSALNLFKGLDDDEPLQNVPLGTLLDEIKREFAELGAEVKIAGAVGAAANGKPQGLKRCLTNLVSNAVKYGGGATVVVEDGADIVLRVLDEGPGIPADSLEQVFEPFFRLESSRNSATGGTGLGLGIARDIAQAHGGSLVLRNRSPRGLEAILTLPKTVRNPA